MLNPGRNDPCRCGSGRKYKQCCLPRDKTPAKSGTPSSGIRIHQALGIALEHQRAGRLQQAEAACRNILQAFPDHPEALHLLGILAHQTGKNETAVQLINDAIRGNPENPLYHLNLGTIYPSLSRVEEALACFRRALVLKPDFAQAHAFMGNLLQDQGRPAEALPCYRKAISCKTDFTEAHNNLGAALQELGQIDEALACFRRAIALKPDFAEAHFNLGNALQGQLRFEEAERCHRQAIEYRSSYAEAHHALGKLFEEQGRLEDALACHRLAVSFRPGLAEAWSSLGALLLQQGRIDEAEPVFKKALRYEPRCSSALLGLSAIALSQGAHDAALTAAIEALRIDETSEAKQAFVACIRNTHFVEAGATIRELLIRALSEPWGRPRELSAASRSVIVSNPDIRACIDRATAAWPTRQSEAALFGPAGLAAVAGEPLLRCLLENVQICDPAFERLLTLSRHVLLVAARQAALADKPEEKLLSFSCALARQCFINEFVYSHTDEEIELAGQLRNNLATALEAESPFPVLWLTAVASYFPLSSLPSINHVTTASWPDPVAGLLRLQVVEPAKERQFGAGLLRLSAVDDEVSRSVQRQYEENPYPRWIKLPTGSRTYSLEGFFARRFPRSPRHPLAGSGGIDILIAGCGTGQHSISTAQQFRDARILAVDLSEKSLCYAKRKTAEHGLENVEYAQADIMKLGSLSRQFDLIESVGVLHHLADPMAGWRTLLSLLKPGGMMMLGLYSELARRDIVAARHFIAGRGYAATAGDIRRCRQELMAIRDDGRFAQLRSRPDFFSTSECRDLLFHVQEHRYTLPWIRAMLDSLGLNFIGFNLGQDVLDRYGKRFPSDQSMTDLDSWNIFETENPDVFAGMYQFWVQKAQDPATEG